MFRIVLQVNGMLIMLPKNKICIYLSGYTPEVKLIFFK